MFDGFVFKSGILCLGFLQPANIRIDVRRDPFLTRCDKVKVCGVYVCSAHDFSYVYFDFILFFFLALCRRFFYISINVIFVAVFIPLWMWIYGNTSNNIRARLSSSFDDIDVLHFVKIHVCIFDSCSSFGASDLFVGQYDKSCQRMKMLLALVPSSFNS